MRNVRPIVVSALLLVTPFVACAEAGTRPSPLGAGADAAITDAADAAAPSGTTPVPGVTSQGPRPLVCGPNLLFNGSLDDPSVGLGWVQSPAFAVVLSLQSTPQPLPFAPHSSPYSAWLGGSTASTVALISDPMILPQHATSMHLRGQRRVASVETLAKHDRYSVQVLDEAMTKSTLVHEESMTQAASTDAWAPFEHAIPGSFAGQTVRFAFVVENDDRDVTSVFVDTLVFEATPCP